MGKVNFNLTLDNLRNTREVWKLVRKAKEGKITIIAWINIKARFLRLRKTLSNKTAEVIFKRKEVR